ncbi:MAG: hypothetical protein ACYTFI_15170 [Planctomycetota bacterium]|jgi:hypothetical protein
MALGVAFSSALLAPCCIAQHVGGRGGVTSAARPSPAGRILDWRRELDVVFVQIDETGVSEGSQLTVIDAESGAHRIALRVDQLNVFDDMVIASCCFSHSGHWLSRLSPKVFKKGTEVWLLEE